MADAAAPQPDAEQQPELQAPETGTSEVTPEFSETVAAEAEVAAGVIQPEPVAEVVEAKQEEATPLPAAALEEPVATEPQPKLETANAFIPQVASTTDVPASAAAASSEGEGGEWELLVEKVKQWISSGQLQQQWETARTPITLLAGLIAMLVVLRIYSSLLGVLESLPLLPGLLELVGVISVVRFSLTRLVKSSDRHEVIDGLKQRWSSFRGNR